MDSSLGDWNCLPHDPLGFFCLQEGFDRKDLKRAYGKLIRRYKPETHPQEFQRIRQAYEQLESLNRYGVRQQLAQDQKSAWESLMRESAEPDPAAPTQREHQDQRPSERPTRRPKRSITELAMADPTDTFRRLKKSETRSPQDYFVLAVLSDLFEREQPHRFLRYLLVGLKEYPADPGLMQLVVEYMRGDVPTKVAPNVLLAAAKACRTASFYRITEPLWERLLREGSFETFQATLKQCESQLKLTDPRPRMVFYIRILRMAMWKAPDEWVDSVLQKLESDATDVDSSADSDLEFLSLVRGYQKEDRPRIGESTTRRRIDKMIQDYCLGDWQSAAATVTQVLDEIARDGHGMMAAFPIVKGADEHRLVMICMIIAADVGSQTGADFDDVDERKSNRQATAALNDLRESLNSVGGRIAWLERRYYWGAFVLLVLVPPFLLYGTLSTGNWAALSTFWVAGTLATYFLYLKPKVLTPKTETKTQRILLQSYENRWRSRLFRYIQSCGEHPGAAFSRLHAASERNGEGGWMGVVLSFVHSDPALTIFGRAQAFVA